MYISKSRFINWTRCPMFFPMELKHNPSGLPDIDAENERRMEALEEMKDGAKSEDDSEDAEEEIFDTAPSMEMETLLPFYNRVEEEALKVAKKYFCGTFVADSKDVHKQKLFEYNHSGHTYRCYVDIYNEKDDEINIIEVKATTNSKYRLKIKEDGKIDGYFFQERPRAEKYPMFVKKDNIWHLNNPENTSEMLKAGFNAKKKALLDRYSDLGKYPHDIAFQKFVIEHALRESGDTRKVNYYLAVLNNQYLYDGAKDASGKCVYNEMDGQEIITFYDMNEIVEKYQTQIREEVATLESYIAAPHNTDVKVPVGPCCSWGKNTQCLYWTHCYQKLRNVPSTNQANNYLLAAQTFMKKQKIDKYWLINNHIWRLEDVDESWLNDSQNIQRYSYNNDKEWVDKEKMGYWLDEIKYPIYHFDFETFPCPLPRFSGENPYRQSPFEFSLHIERDPGVCDKQADNFIFLNREFDDDERLALVKAIIDHFEFNDDGTLHGTMLAQNTSFEQGRLTELAKLFPEYKDKLLAIRDKSMDLIHLLKTKKELYQEKFGENKAKTINYYHKDLSGSYSIKKTLPVLVPSLTYKGMEVGNGSQAYIAYINYDSPTPTIFDGHPMNTKADRRAALERYCQQDTWAMVEILRSVREKIK